MTSEQALAYGMIDQIIERRPRTSAPENNGEPPAVIAAPHET